MRLLITLDENDQVVKYEEKRIVITEEMFDIGEEAEVESVNGDEENMEDTYESDENKYVDDGFVVNNDVLNCVDEDYVPSAGEMETAELEEAMEEEIEEDIEEDTEIESDCERQ